MVHFLLLSPGSRVAVYKFVDLYFCELRACPILEDLFGRSPETLGFLLQQRKERVRGIKLVQQVANVVVLLVWVVKVKSFCVFDRIVYDYDIAN